MSATEKQVALKFAVLKGGTEVRAARTEAVTSIPSGRTVKTGTIERLRRHIAITTFTVIAALWSAAAFGGEGTIHVSAWVNNTVQECDLATGMYLGIFASTPRPSGLAFDIAGNLYVANEVGNTITKFSPNGVGSVFARTGLNQPNGIAFDRAGNLYVANQGNNAIEKFTPNGVGSVFANTASMPTGLAFDSTGNLLVTAFNSGIIQKFTPQGVGSTFATVGVAGLIGLAIDSEGNVYTTLNTSILKYTPDGVGSTWANTGGFIWPDGLAFDNEGNLYSANEANNMIQKFTPDGVVSIFSTGLGGPAFLAIQEIPEPSTWGLIVLGAVALTLPRPGQAGSA